MIEILNHTSPNNWFHCDGHDMLSDQGSRGRLISDLSFDLWFSGPSWLRTPDYKFKLPDSMTTQKLKNAPQRDRILSQKCSLATTFRQKNIQTGSDYLVSKQLLDLQKRKACHGSPDLLVLYIMLCWRKPFILVPSSRFYAWLVW